MPSRHIVGVWVRWSGMHGWCSFLKSSSTIHSCLQVMKQAPQQLLGMVVESVVTWCTCSTTGGAASVGFPLTGSAPVAIQCAGQGQQRVPRGSRQPSVMAISNILGPECDWTCWRNLVCCWGSMWWVLTWHFGLWRLYLAAQQGFLGYLIIDDVDFSGIFLWLYIDMVGCYTLPFGCSDFTFRQYMTVYACKTYILLFIDVVGCCSRFCCETG